MTGEPAAGDGGAEGALPKWHDSLVEQLDEIITRRPDRRLPALLFHRASSGEPGGLTAADLVVLHQRRLRSDNGIHIVSFVPHSLVSDEQFASAGQKSRRGAGDEPHIAILDRIANDFQTTMPSRAGRLRLPRFYVCRDVLGIRLDNGDLRARRAQLRAELYKRARARPRVSDDLGKAAKAAEESFLPKVLHGVPHLVAPLLRIVHRARLARGRRLRWVNQRINVPGRNFFTGALEITRNGGSRSNDALVQRVLLTALLLDLEEACRPSFFRLGRAYRAWSFVLLLRQIGPPGSPCRMLLDTFASVQPTLRRPIVRRPVPLLLLAGVDEHVPTAAVRIAAGDVDGRRGALAERVSQLIAAPPGGDVDPVYVLPLSPEPDDGSARDSLIANPRAPRRSLTARDFARPIALVAAVALLLATAGAVVDRTVFRSKPAAAATLTPGCQRDHAPSGETVGITDGAPACDLATGQYAQQLRDLEKLAYQQNSAVDRSRPYRSVVFFAPLTVGENSKRATPTGLQALRGALLAQQQANHQQTKSWVQVRLLIANAGEYFIYGSRGAKNKENTTSIDVAQEIIARLDLDRIAAVAGITQSRETSVQAIQELGQRQIPVLGASVTGDELVNADSPITYFQLGPPNTRAAAAMATFTQQATRLRALTGRPRTGGAGPPAVVVYDPKDTVFSGDLKDDFISDYTKSGSSVADVIPYTEQGGVSTTVPADQICQTAVAKHGVIVFVGRSGVMPDLFTYLNSSPNCQVDGKIPVLAESPAPDILAAPQDMDLRYPRLALFYMQYSTPDLDKQYAELYAAQFKGLKPDPDTASGIDLIRVLSFVMDQLVPDPANDDFRPAEVARFLQKPGVSFPGETGMITLGNGLKYPPNKPVYVREIEPGGATSTPMRCGAVRGNPRAAANDPSEGEFQCPVD